MIRPHDSRRLRGAALATALVVWLVPAGSTSLSGQAAPRGRALALQGATILTVTNGIIQNGTIVVRDGKIVAVGADVPVPAGADVIDVSGRFVTPGLIDAHSHIAADSINESGTTVSSMTGMEDVLNASDINIYRDLAGGLTTANILHGSANPIGGKNAVIKLRWGKTRADELFFDGAMPGIKFALGENPKDMRQFGQTGPRRYPTTRAGVEYVIRDAFTRAKAYQKEWKDYEAARAAGRQALAPRRDLQLEPLVEILEGKRLVHAHCYRADEILMLIRLAEEMGFTIATFQHVLEGYKVAKEIAAHGAGASTFSDWWGFKVEAANAIPHNAAIMARKGVLVSINSASAEHARRLNTEAAKSIRWGGLSEDEALALVTINPAKQLRIDHRVGSLEPGKDADIAVWTRHPLSNYAVVERTYIDGVLYYDRQAEDRRLTELLKEKETLAAAERRDRRTPATAATTTPETPRAATESDERSGDGDGHPASNGAGARSRIGNGSPAPSGAAGPVWAITNATIHPVSGAPIQGGTIVIRGGKIEAVGAGIQVPSGITVVDAAGGHVYPGFINARTTIGLAEPGPRGFDDVSEMLDYNPSLRTRVAYHAASDAIPVARATGVTTVAVVPAGGVLGGEVPIMNLDGWTWEDATVRPVAGITFNLPSTGPRGFFFGAPFGGDQPERSYEDLKKERDKALEGVEQLLDRTRAYAGAGAGSTTDWTLEALVPVVERKVPLITVANREEDIREALAFAERARIDIVLAGGAEAALVAPLLRDRNVPVILGNVLTLPSREDFFHASSYQVAGELAKAGVKFAFSTGDNTNVRQLPFGAAMAVAWGLDRDRALRALTLDAAEILGVADRVGSLEPGKDANLFVAKGDPLELRTEITHVVINGVDVGLSNKHEELFRKYMARP